MKHLRQNLAVKLEPDFQCSFKFHPGKLALPVQWIEKWTNFWIRFFATSTYQSVWGRFADNKPPEASLLFQVEAFYNWEFIHCTDSERYGRSSWTCYLTVLKDYIGEQRGFIDAFITSPKSCHTNILVCSSAARFSPRRMYSGFVKNLEARNALTHSLVRTAQRRTQFYSFNHFKFNCEHTNLYRIYI